MTSLAELGFDLGAGSMTLDLPALLREVSAVTILHAHMGPMRLAAWGPGY